MHKTRLEYQVAYADTDMMGVVYYANYLVFFERARTRLLEDFGYPYWRLEAEGIGLPVIEAHCEYKIPAVYGDTLEVFAWTDWVKPVRLKVCCEVRRGNTLLALGHTVHAGLSLASKKPAPLPEAFRQACCGAEPQSHRATAVDRSRQKSTEVD